MAVDSEEIDAHSYDDYGYDDRHDYSHCIYHLANSGIIIYKLIVQITTSQYNVFKSYYNPYQYTHDYSPSLFNSKRRYL